MSHSRSLQCFACWVVLGALWSWLPGEAAEPRIYIMTDLEGASGVYKFAQTREPDPQLGERAKEYLMEDIRYVVRGLRGRCDGYPGRRRPRITGLRAAPDGTGRQVLDGAAAPGRQLGIGCILCRLGTGRAHAMMGTSDGVLCHTQSSRSENRYWYNGVESGELAQCAAIAGHFGVPPIMVTGDEATCREATQFFGPECVTVAVKQGVVREAAVLYPFEETHQALFEGAKRAMSVIGRCKPYRLTVPIQAKKQYLIFDGPNEPGRLTTKEGTIDDVLKLFEF